MPELPQPSEPTDLSTEIGGSLGSIWGRYAGSRPENASVEIGDGVVRWTIHDGADVIKDGLKEQEPVDGAPLRTIEGFQHDASAAVAKATRRRIAAHISKKTKTGDATEVFILEELPRKF